MADYEMTAEGKVVTRKKYGVELSEWFMDMVHDTVMPRLMDGQTREPQWPEIPLIHLFQRADANLRAAATIMVSSVPHASHGDGRELRDDSQAIKELVDAALYCLFAIDKIRNITKEDSDAEK